MTPRRLFERILAVVGEGRRRRIIVGVVVLGLVATAVAVPLSGGGDPDEIATFYRAEGCNAAPAIDRPPTAKAKNWREVAVPEARACSVLTASDRDAAGVAPGATFVLAAAEAIEAASLTKRLVVEPAVRFTVASESPTRLRIRPAAALTPGTVYRFSLLDAPGGRPVQRWAFQARSPLHVVQTLPRNESTDVPLNIGIELTFSHDGVTGVSDRFSIMPKTDGRFETHKRVVVFVPKKLEPRTLYTVTLRPGVALQGSKERTTTPFIFRFETGSDERSGDTPGEPLLQFGRAVWESATKEPPVVSLFFSAGDETSKPPPTVPFTVYRFADVDAFLASLGRFTAVPTWAGFTRASFVASTKGLSKAVTFRGHLESLGDQGDLYVRFPDTLPAGFYLVATAHDKVPIQTWLQVTDVASYAAVSRERVLVWANDVAAKAALGGASVRVAGGSSAAKTGGDGVASFSTPTDLLRLTPAELGEEADVTGNLIVTARDGRLAVVPLADIFSGFHSFEFREYTFQGDPQPYWRFLYADRQLYRPSDTIRFWGLIRKRVAPAGKQDVIVEFADPYNEDGRTAPVASTTVRTTERGTFIGELPFAGVAPGYYQLTARIGTQVIAAASFEVEDFVKPAYKLDVLPSRRAIVSGQPVTYAIAASFFEGSPVPNLGLRYVAGFDGTETDVTTGESGGATVRLRLRTDSISFEPFRVFPALAEEGEITGETSVTVFPATLALRAEGIVAGNRGRIDGTVFDIDFAKINASANEDDFDYEGAPRSGRRVTATVTEITWKKIEEGETYDFIAKIVRKNYRYEERRKNIGTFSDTSGAGGRFTISFPANAKRSYEVALRVVDDEGRSYRETTYLSSSFDVYSSFPYLAGSRDGPFAVGDTVEVAMRQGVSDLPAGGSNRYLFYTAADGIREHAVRTSPRYAFRFAESHVPNVDVLAVRFDGTTYYETAYGYNAMFDAELRRLTVTITPDAPRYEPGQKAGLNVRVTDRRGRPVRAEVLLSAVDEALFRVHPDSFLGDRDILEALYDPLSSGVLRAYASHQYPTEFNGAESGGEGGDRVDFRDVGIFTRVTTGADGRASTPFELPDNLTSWRVTGLAVSDSLQAGTTTALVPVGLPMFVDVGLNDSYLVGDRAFARVRAFGSDLSSGDRVEFKLEAPTLGKPSVARSTAFKPVDIALPPLREGTHRITVRAVANDRVDSLVRTITVVASRLTRIVSRSAEVLPGQTFTPPGSEKGPTGVVLTDHNRGRYYPALEELSWTRGDRVDQMLARNLAQEMVAKYFDEPSLFPALFRPSAYQTEEGGIAIFPFADDDLAISARVAALAPDRFGRDALAAYFWGVLADRETTREHGIVALYGLAALGEPVLLDVQRAGAQKDLSAREGLYVGLAAQELGDEPAARAAYAALLERYGEARGGLVRLNVGEDQDDILEATSLAAILGAGLADDAAPAMFDYVARTYARDLFLALEQISFLAEALPRLSERPSKVAYTLAGERRTVELSHGESIALRLSAAERRGLNLAVLEGATGVATSWIEALAPKDAVKDPDASLTRTWNGVTSGTETLNEGDLVQIVISYRLTAKALDGCYQVTDLLPSGLRAVTRPFDRGIEEANVSYPYAIEGQRVSFCVYKGRQPAIVYYARVTGRGTFTAEPATIQSQDGPERISLSKPIRVQVR